MPDGCNRRCRGKVFQVRRQEGGIGSIKRVIRKGAQQAVGAVYSGGSTGAAGAGASRGGRLGDLHLPRVGVEGEVGLALRVAAHDAVGLAVARHGEDVAKVLRQGRG